MPKRKRKRGPNEGTIFEEKPGRWVASITLGYEIVDGHRRRKRKKFVGSSFKAVQKRLTEALREHQTGGTVPIQRDNLGAFLRTWIPTLKARGRSEKTIESYQWIAEHHIIPELGTVPLTQLTQVALNEYMQCKLEGGLSSRTVRYCHAIIRSALSKAERDGLVGRNVAKLAEPPAQERKHKVEPLNPDEARKFLVAIEGHRLEALYSVALAVGLRRGEALGLKWTGVDLGTGLIRVTQTVQRIKGKGLVISESAKTDKSIRMIPLPGFAIAALQRHKDRQRQERQFAGDEWKETRTRVLFNCRNTDRTA
jgi:integrase